MSQHDRSSSTGDDAPFLAHPVPVDAPPQPAVCEPPDLPAEEVETDREPAELTPTAQP